MKTETEGKTKAWCMRAMKVKRQGLKNIKTCVTILVSVKDVGCIMITPVISRLSAINSMNNAAYGMMQSSNALMGLISFAGTNPNVDLGKLNSVEKNLMMKMLNDSFIYKISQAQEKQLKKLEQDNIKHSFSTFA